MHRHIHCSKNDFAFTKAMGNHIRFESHQSHDKTGGTILVAILDIEPSILRQRYVEKPSIQIYFIIPSCQAVTL